MELKNVKKIVLELLKENEELRGDDDLLILAVYEKIDPFISSYGFSYVMKNRKNGHYPSFESIRRARAKLQEEFQELKPEERIQRERELNEYKYRELARE